MDGELPVDARRVLQYLRDRLPNVVPGRPETYAKYKEVHDALGLTMQGPTYGESLKRQGLESLARWTADRGFPAVTGLVVDGSTFLPGEGFFRLYGRRSDDFSWWREESSKGRRFDWNSVLENEGYGNSRSAPLLDPEFRRFLAGFLKPDSRYLLDWLPRYEATTAKIRESIQSGALEDALEIVWRKQDNSVAHAGQGVLSFESVDRLSEPLKQQLLEVARDPSPGSFVRISEAMQEWKAQDLISRFPALLLARAFASIAPQTYHTTVDVRKHDLVIAWIEEHSSFRCPPSPHWAERAAALTEFLGRIDELRDQPLVRNMFPWFVYEQIARAADGKPTFIPGYRDKPEEAIGVITERVRKIQLRHNVLTRHLVRLLEEEHGVGSVGVDQPSGSGGWVDAVLKHPNGDVWLYEIKVVPTASLAVREALGQLLEYGFQPGGWNPAKLFVVAEPELDKGTEEYMELLRERFKLPIEYLQVIAG